jgi:hypothetical protein
MTVPPEDGFPAQLYLKLDWRLGLEDSEEGTLG